MTNRTLSQIADEQPKPWEDAMHDSVGECLDKARKKLMTELFYKDLKKRLHTDSVTQLFGNHSLLQGLEDRMEKSEWGKIAAKDTIALFVTFSPDPELKLTGMDVKLIVSKFLSKKTGMKSCHFNIEQSGTVAGGNVGYHPHSHILIELDKSCQTGERKRMKNKIERYFSKYRTKSNAYLDVRAVSATTYPKKLDYINGKKEADKAAQLEADTVYREQCGLDRVYSILFETN